MADTHTRASRTGADDSDTADHRAPERSAFNFEQSSENQSIPDLLHRLAHQGSHLAEQQMNLLQAEMRSGLADIKEGVAAIAGAAVLGIAAVGVLLMAASFLIANAMPLWVATAIVGVVAAIAAYAMYRAAMSKLQSKAMTAERTRRTLERAPEALTGHTNEDHRHDR